MAAPPAGATGRDGRERPRPGPEPPGPPGSTDDGRAEHVDTPLADLLPSAGPARDDAAAGRPDRGRRAAGMTVRRIVSGGQTGVDRAALDVARALGIACGGWCPRGRRAEDGRIPDRYPLRETESRDYATRTRLNVRDSDATLVLTRGAPTGGTRLTVDVAVFAGRPVLVIDLDGDREAGLDAARRWLAETPVRTLNVAGPRESTAPGIYAEAADFLRRLLAVRERG